MSEPLPLFVRIETGTSDIVNVIINPLFLLLAEIEMTRLRTIAEAFGIRPQETR